MLIEPDDALGLFRPASGIYMLLAEVMVSAWSGVSSQWSAAHLSVKLMINCRMLGLFGSNLHANCSSQYAQIFSSA